MSTPNNENPNSVFNQKDLDKLNDLKDNLSASENTDNPKDGVGNTLVGTSEKVKNDVSLAEISKKREEIRIKRKQNEIRLDKIAGLLRKGTRGDRKETQLDIKKLQEEQVKILAEQRELSQEDKKLLAEEIRLQNTDGSSVNKTGDNKNLTAQESVEKVAVVENIAKEENIQEKSAMTVEQAELEYINKRLAELAQKKLEHSRELKEIQTKLNELRTQK